MSMAGRSASTPHVTPKPYGIETIYQTLALADNIDAPGNMFLGRELLTKLEDARRFRDGGRHPANHGAAQPEVQEFQDRR